MSSEPRSSEEYPSKAPLVGLSFCCKVLSWKGVEYDAGSFIDSNGSTHYIVTFFREDKPVLTDKISFYDIDQKRWLFYDPLKTDKNKARENVTKK